VLDILFVVEQICQKGKVEIVISLGTVRLKASADKQPTYFTDPPFPAFANPFLSEHSLANVRNSR
jgi:hypothetical protein